MNGDGLRVAYTSAFERDDQRTRGYVWDTNVGTPVVLEDDVNRFVYAGSLLYTVKKNDLTASSGYRVAHADGSGSLIAQTNSSGTVVAVYRTDAWGDRPQVEGEAVSDFGFQGELTQQLSSTSSLVYLRSRVYHTQLGRFLTRDRAGTLNRYSFANNNPTSNTDASGYGSAPNPSGPYQPEETPNCGEKGKGCAGPQPDQPEPGTVAPPVRPHAPTGTTPGGPQPSIPAPPVPPVAAEPIPCPICPVVVFAVLFGTSPFAQQDTPQRSETQETSAGPIVDSFVAVASLLPIGLPARTARAVPLGVLGAYVPNRVSKLAKSIVDNDYRAPAGHVNRPFYNKENGLPLEGTYWEYDVWPQSYMKGRGAANRGGERIIIDLDSGRAWYTYNHLGSGCFLSSPEYLDPWRQSSER